MLLDECAKATRIIQDSKKIECGPYEGEEVIFYQDEVASAIIEQDKDKS